MYKGDTFLNVGTIEELAKWANMSIKKIKYYSYPSIVKRNEDNALYVFKLDFKEED